MKTIADIPTPQLNDLKEIFNFMYNSTANGVKGIYCIDSGIEGPTVGITMCTHGNEPAGLATLWFYLTKYPLADYLLKGKVYFILVNMEASRNYWEAPTKIERYKQRYVDYNMNRLKPAVKHPSDDTRYETVRFQEIASTLAIFDIGVDIHSTSQEAPPMLATCYKFDFNLVREFPIQYYLSGFSEVMDSYFISSFFGANIAKGVLIECGKHENPYTFQTAIFCANALLCKLNMINHQIIASVNSFNHYQIKEAIFFSDDTWVQSRIFPNFDKILKNEVIAVNSNGEQIVAPFDGHALMGPNQLRPQFIDEEILFISKPVEIINFNDIK